MKTSTIDSDRKNNSQPTSEEVWQALEYFAGKHGGNETPEFVQAVKEWEAAGWPVIYGNRRG